MNYKYTLPTEAQWEYACRAGTTTALNNGKNLLTSWLSTDVNLDEVAWYGGNSDYKVHEVGQKLPNAWGFYDMHGNVLEWCLDWYGTLSYGTDPKGSSSGSSRVLRGGGWDYYAGDCASSSRISNVPSGGYSGLGFRLVRTLSN